MSYYQKKKIPIWLICRARIGGTEIQRGGQKFIGGGGRNKNGPVP